MSKSKIIGVNERVPLTKGIPLSIQHTFAMFSASILVPWLVGINPSIVLLMNGIGTLLFILITRGKAPAYLGSSFAFLSPIFIIIANKNLGYQYALGGFIVSGIIFCVIALLIKFVGTKWIDVVLPPAAMGPVVALIGLELAGTAAKTGAIVPNPDNGYTSLDPKLIAIFCITLLVAIFGGVVFRGFASAIAILISIVVGYLSALAFGVVDFSAISSASVFSLPTFKIGRAHV